MNVTVNCVVWLQGEDVSSRITGINLSKTEMKYLNDVIMYVHSIAA